MREIKFRAWIYDRTNKRGKMYYAKDFGGSDASLFNYFSERGVDGEDFLMQSTGLKDKNGVEIYGGDKVKSKNSPIWEVRYQPEFCRYILWWNDPEDGPSYVLFGNDLELEVIGNIHEDKP